MLVVAKWASYMTTIYSTTYMVEGKFLVRKQLHPCMLILHTIVVLSQALGPTLGPPLVQPLDCMASGTPGHVPPKISSLPAS